MLSRIIQDLNEEEYSPGNLLSCYKMLGRKTKIIGIFAWKRDCYNRSGCNGFCLVYVYIHQTQTTRHILNTGATAPTATGSGFFLPGCKLFSGQCKFLKLSFYFSVLLSNMYIWCTVPDMNLVIRISGLQKVVQLLSGYLRFEGVFSNFSC